MEDLDTAIERRIDVRRDGDVKRNALILGLAGMLITGGIAWGTAMSVVQQKVDRAEFAAFKAESDRRALVDSVRAITLTETISEVKRITLETNTRLSRYICDKQAAYCQ